MNQTVKPNQIVIVKDGPLSEELDKILNRYVYLDNSLYTIVKLEKNVGLGGGIS